MTVRVMIVDDEELARQRIRRLLAREEDVEVVGEASDGMQAVESIRSLVPDLVFLDVQMPEVDGFAVLERLRPQLAPAIVFVKGIPESASAAEAPVMASTSESFSASADSSSEMICVSWRQP